MRQQPAPAAAPTEAPRAEHTPHPANMPPTVLALRRDLGSAIGFHGIQDVLRFLAGF